MLFQEDVPPDRRRHTRRGVGAGLQVRPAPQSPALPAALPAVYKPHPAPPRLVRPRSRPGLSACTSPHGGSQPGMHVSGPCSNELLFTYLQLHIWPSGHVPLPHLPLHVLAEGSHTLSAGHGGEQRASAQKLWYQSPENTQASPSAVQLS